MQLKRPARPPPHPRPACSRGTPVAGAAFAAFEPLAIGVHPGQSGEPRKRALLVAAKLSVAQARDRFAQERRRWSQVSHAPPMATAPSAALTESLPPSWRSSLPLPSEGESTTDFAAISTAPTIIGSSSSSASSCPPPACAPLHRTTRMAPGELHVRAAEANFANAMLRLVSLTPAADRNKADVGAGTGAALTGTVAAQRAVDDANISAPTAAQPGPLRLLPRGCAPPTGCRTKPTGPIQ